MFKLSSFSQAKSDYCFFRMITTKLCTRSGFTAACLLTFAPSLANAMYSVTDLGVAPGAMYCVGTAMNESGQVTGNCSFGGSFHAFLYSGGTINDLGVPTGFNSSYAYGINNYGHIVGTLERPGSPFEAMFWDGNATHSLGGSLQQGIGINDSDQVGGVGGTPGTYQYAGGTVNIVNPPGTVTVYDLNNRGQATGITGGDNSNTHAYFFDGNSVQDIGTFGGVMSQALGVNIHGEVVGFATRPDESRHAFLWDGSLIDIGTLGGAHSSAFGLNDLGTVVGNSETPTGSLHATIWDSTYGIRDLNDFIPNNSGWYLEGAFSINNSGVIMGAGQHNGRTSTFLLQAAPVPEANTAKLFAIGLLILPILRHRRQER